MACERARIDPGQLFMMWRRLLMGDIQELVQSKVESCRRQAVVWCSGYACWRFPHDSLCADFDGQLLVSCSGSHHTDVPDDDLANWARKGVNMPYHDACLLPHCSSPTLRSRKHTRELPCPCSVHRFSIRLDRVPGLYIGDKTPDETLRKSRSPLGNTAATRSH